MSTENTEGISIRAFARDMGVTEGAIRKMIKSGVITAASVGKAPGTGWPIIFPDKAREDIATYRSAPTAARKEQRKKVAAKKQQQPIEEEEEDDEEEAKDQTPIPGRRTKAALDVLLAEIKVQQEAIKLREMKGELVDKKNVYRELYELGQELRKDIMAVPDKTLDNIRAAKTRMEAYEILRAALTDVLTAFSQIKDGDLKFKSR